MTIEKHHIALATASLAIVAQVMTGGDTTLELNTNAILLSSTQNVVAVDMTLSGNITAVRHKNSVFGVTLKNEKTATGWIINRGDADVNQAPIVNGRGADKLYTFVGKQGNVVDLECSGPCTLSGTGRIYFVSGDTTDIIIK